MKSERKRGATGEWGAQGCHECNRTQNRYYHCDEKTSQGEISDLPQDTASSLYLAQSVSRNSQKHSRRKNRQLGVWVKLILAVLTLVGQTSFIPVVRYAQFRGFLKLVNNSLGFYVEVT